MKKVASLFLSMMLCATFHAHAMQTVIEEVPLNKKLYPVVTSDGLDTFFSKVIPLDSGTYVGFVGLITDWWQKRPTEIRVYEWTNGKKGKLMALKQFLQYDDAVCGDDFQQYCSYPDNPQGRLTVPVNAVVGSSIVVEIDGLLSIANEYAILKSLQVF